MDWLFLDILIADKQIYRLQSKQLKYMFGEITLCNVEKVVALLLLDVAVHPPDSVLKEFV
ncbi:MAG: hypothetical protein BGO49_18245 [Planctomycetales bacterium 71-10]|nr:MAG: hypothetical protein BGO49_18245 [Planctomycetales bacterium 71-10]